MPLYDIDEGVLQPKIYVSVMDEQTGQLSVIPSAVLEWLESVDKRLALSIVEAWYASDK